MSRPRRRPKPKPRPKQPPSTEALKGRAYGSRPARPLPKPRPAPAPRARPVAKPRPAAPQAQAYVSQGKAVEKVANQQRRRAQRVRAQVKAVSTTGGDFDVSLRSGPKSDDAAKRAARKIGKPITVGADNHYYVKVKRTALPDRHLPVDPFTGKVDRKYLHSGRSNAGKQQEAAIQAPALKVLDQTTRPVHGVMAATRAGIKAHGGGVQGLVKSQLSVQSPSSRAAKAQRKAFKRGVQLKDRSLGSDVLKDIGVKNKTVRSAAGFALDVVADPTTYITGGTGSVAEKAAAKAATRVRRKAVQHGMDEEAAQRLAATAAKQARKTAPTGRGVSVRFAGQEVPGVRRATGATARGTRKVARKVAPRASQTVPAVARTVVREFAPRVAPAGVKAEQNLVARAQTRASRARASQGAERAEMFERELKQRLSKEDHARVIDALERDNLSRVIAPTRKQREKLAKDDPKEYARRQQLAKLAHNLRSELKGVHREAIRVGAQPRPAKMGEYLGPQDLSKLDKSVAAEQRAQKKGLSRKLGQPEQHARENALITARLHLAEAQRALRAELKKPVAKRKGVAALETRVQAAHEAWQQARRPSTVRSTQRAEAVAQIRPRGVRAPVPQATTKYGERVAGSEAQRARLQAAQNVPKRSLNESAEQYLKRVEAHAARHDLPIVRRRAQKLLAAKPNQARGYYPRELEERMSRTERFVDRITGTQPEFRQVGRNARLVTKTTAGNVRQDIRPLREVNPERQAKGQAPFSTDVPLVVGNHLREAARATSSGEFAQNMARAIGRPVRRGEKVGDHEDLYKLGYEGRRFGLHKVTAGEIPKRQGGGGQYVAMPRNFFEQMERSTKGTATDNPLLMTFDRIQGGWKRTATFSLGFHIRNLIGDIQAGYYLPGAGGSIGKIPQAAKATRRLSEQTRMIRPPASKATIKVAGKKQELDSFLKLARDNGVLDVGVVAREVRDIGQHELSRGRARGARTAAGSAARRGGRAVDRWLTNRENLMRLAAFKHGLDRGMKPHEAADMANLFHIDYSELSRTERAFMRRLMPFYTWTARSLPVAGLTLIQKPGKFANLEKLREEIGAGFTGQSEEQQRAGMPESVKRNLPVVIRVGDGTYAVSASIPATLLNEIPAGTDIGKYLDEISHFGFGMVGPLAGGKAATELYMNQSFFTRRPIEDPSNQGGLVPAPQWIGKAPDFIKKATGAVQGPDRDTGKTIWKWRGRADWLSRQAPGMPQQALQVGQASRDLPENAAVASAVSGIRADKLGQVAAGRAQKNRLREELKPLERRAGVLNAQGIHSDNATPEYRALRKRINEINRTLYPRKRKRGGSSDLSPSDIGLGSTGSDLTPADIGLGN